MLSAFICILVGCSLKEDLVTGNKLFLAIKLNNIQACEEALREEKINLEKIGKGESTEFGEYDQRALGLAISNRTNPHIIKALIEHGADVNSVLKNRSTYLMAAVINRDLDLCKVLLDNGADVHAKNEDGYTVMDELFGTVQDESSHVNTDELWEYAKLLIENGATVTTRTLERYIEANGYSCIKRLIVQLEQQGDLQIKDELKYAMLGNNEELLKLLTCEEISDKETVLRYAVANCNVEVLEKLKKSGCDFTYVDESGQTLLHIAAKYNTVDVVEFILRQNKNEVLCTDFFQWNVLTMAMFGGNEETVQWLLEHGIEWQRGGTGGGDSWIAACMSGTAEALQILLNCGFEPTSEEIVYGYENCNEKTFEFLVKNNISYLEIWDGDTGIEMLCALKPEYARRIVENDPNIEITPSIIESAISSGNRDFAMEIIDIANDINVWHTMSPLENAVVVGDLEMVEYMIDKGADINYPIEYDVQHTVMHTAAENPSSDILEYLMEQGGDISVKDGQGLLPLDRAKEAEIVTNVRLLENE